MSKLFFTLLFTFLFSNLLFCQSSEQKVFTQDIDNFWVAYDSVKTTNDSLQKIHFIQTLYIDKGTPGLKAFMKARDYDAERYVDLINKYPKFWKSIRPNTLSVKGKTNEIKKSISKLKILYPELKPARMYFTIGGLRSGGTTTDDLVLVGTEIATGNALTDVSEFPNKWLAGVFKEQTSTNIVSLNIHEFIHTQQSGESNNVLAQVIKEGSCDFITELVIGKQLQRNYITYGKNHEQELKAMFKTDMFTSAFGKWLYNGSNTETVADLGYFIGYEICKSYYAHANNKKQAIEKIIELNYSDTLAVEGFLQQSMYYTEQIDKLQLLQSFRQKQPELIKSVPVENGDTLVDASLKEMAFIFSKPMSKGYSINLSEKGKEFYPITGVIGLSGDQTKFSVNIELQPNHEYEFIISNNSFSSTERYPLLKDYRIKFKTKP